VHLLLATAELLDAEEAPLLPWIATLKPPCTGNGRGDHRPTVQVRSRAGRPRSGQVAVGLHLGDRARRGDSVVSCPWRSRR
jgi:hypothetical protein